MWAGPGSRYRDATCSTATTASGFAVAGYDTSLPLVIDPVITYSSYLGGSGDEFSIWSDIDRAGNFYVTGFTNSPDFPTTGGVFQPTFAGGDGDAFVAKLNRSGSGLVRSTYLGGDASDVGIGLDVDRHGNVVVAGETSSTGFPTTRGRSSAPSPVARPTRS
jgi:Beta-propeller repeat